MATPELAGILDHTGPWTEEDFLALPEDRRIELLDGELLVSPFAGYGHQRVASRLWRVLDEAAPRQVEVFETVNVRVGSGRILIPDLVVVTEPGLDVAIADAALVALVVEILSPGAVVAHRALKPQLYAAAGIPSYLRVELGAAPSAAVFALASGRYEQVAAAPPGGVLRLDEPFSAEIDLAALVARR
ncbi:Uma2 family endonuclease [Pseudonocardia sp. RS11V-5]|uniref:Uma2 family endonuclease n=1 Tax=Pseudonocardia terrae TaxID=2905831 RepID=UPI001E402985|nr:Uma2 family endonuclease [Pseudonocardia terrae]MCE3554951.1 Uma2 family endonuclease [Pseudonocardia terrae]